MTTLLKQIMNTLMNMFRKKRRNTNIDIKKEVKIIAKVIKKEKETIKKEQPMFKDTTVILDAGHGGIIDGVYQTNGKRSPVWEDGTQYFEGEGNRAIVKLINDQLKEAGIKTILTASTQKDTKLQARCDLANDVEGDSIFISVHSNAGGGEGFESFSYRKTGKSAEMNTIFYDEAAKEFPEARMRYGNKEKLQGKTANYKVLKDTNMPAVLLEWFFMDTEEDCAILLSKEGKERIADATVNAIKRILS
jgi:N-acetylmuramoyl-L-alanine amidase